VANAADGLVATTDAKAMSTTTLRMPPNRSRRLRSDRARCHTRNARRFHWGSPNNLVEVWITGKSNRRFAAGACSFAGFAESHI